MNILKEQNGRGVILITTSTFAEFDSSPIELLKQNGFDVKTNPYGRKLKKEELISAIPGVVGMIAGTEPIDEEVIDTAKELKVISRCGVGIDNVDLDAAKKSGVIVKNTPHGPTKAVAELTIGLILDLLRGISCFDRQLKAKVWKKKMGGLLEGKKVGVIGYGRIGQAVSKLLGAFGVDLAYTDIATVHGSVKKMEMAELLAWADIITIHVSGAFEGKPIISENEIKKMKKGSWLVNVSRGGVVDEDALYTALESGKLAGAALDVFEKEPYEGPFVNLDNVILTPHIGSYAKEARIAMETQAALNLLIELGVIKQG